MLELLISLLMTQLPTCPTEDSYWCTMVRQPEITINLGERDPGPISIVFTR